MPMPHLAPVKPVEHVKVGAYRFPLYSHPLFRVRLAEDAYVERRVQACLQDPSLYTAMNDVVEALLAQGREGASMDDIQQLMETQLGGLDSYWLPQPQPTGASTPQVGVKDASAALPSLTSAYVGPWSSPVSRGHASSRGVPRYETAEKAATRQGLFLSSAHDALAPSRTHRPVSKAAAGVRDPSTEYVSSVDDAGASTALSTRNYFTLPTVTPSVVPAHDYVPAGPDSFSSGRAPPRQFVSTANADSSTCQTRSTLADATDSTRFHSVARASASLPQWRGACRDAVYSLLHIRLQEAVDQDASGGEYSNRQTRMLHAIAEARERQRALDGNALAALAPASYAGLDVVLDGNSTCLSRRTHAGHGDERVKIMERSRALCAQQQPQQTLLRTVASRKHASSSSSAKASVQSVKARRIAAQHQRTIAQEQTRRENDGEQEARRREGLERSPAWW